MTYYTIAIHTEDINNRPCDYTTVRDERSFKKTWGRESRELQNLTL